MLLAEPVARANSFVGTEEYLAPEVRACGRDLPANTHKLKLRICISCLHTHKHTSCHWVKCMTPCVLMVWCRSSIPDPDQLCAAVAVQVINAAGHSAPVDWWSFGILLYELMFGTTPFR